MPRVYDIALVGAGPAGFAALTALQGYGGKVAVVTGATPGNGSVRHGKIRSVAYERGKAAAIGERASGRDGRGEIFATAEVGGLANYWGQQVFPYRPKDPWGQGKLLPTWDAYRVACTAIESGLIVTGGVERGRLISLGEAVRMQEPRLLVGTRTHPDAGLAAICTAVSDRLATLPAAELVSARVVRLEAGPRLVRLILSCGTDLWARRVLLAAGVPGTAGILNRSLSPATEARFSDHAPHLLLTFGINRLLRRVLLPKTDHFNALTIWREQEERVDMFASVYSMSRAPLSLLTTMLGLGPIGRNLRPIGLIDVFRPVQLWTTNTIARCIYHPESGRFEADVNPTSEDRVLRYVLEWLRRNFVVVIALSTAPGQGFHFHRLEFSDGRGPAVAVDDVLRHTFDDRVTCIDASVLRDIGCMPHTLTAMIHGYARTRFVAAGLA